MKRLLLTLALLLISSPAHAQYTTGRVAPTVGQFQALKGSALVAEDLPAMEKATEPKWDSRTKGWVGAVKNQGDCGSCWDFSGTFVAEVAFAKAKKGTVVLSEQYTLSCYENGGCNGDDNTTVLKHAKKIGLPLHSDYGPYTAREGRCDLKQGAKLLKLENWGFADGDAGYEQIGKTQKIKDAIKTFGGVGCAIAADNAFMNVRPGQVFRGSSRQINHDVALVGWDDTLSHGKTVWLLRNSWGTGWCDGGYCLIEEGANHVGTEPVFAYVKADEPDPVPPVPPTPPAPHAHLWLVFACGVVVGASSAAFIILLTVRKK